MQPQYRAYAQQAPPQRSPHAPNQRRGGIGPIMATHPSAPMTHAQMAQQQQAQLQPNDLAKRRSRKPTDKNMPDGVEDCIIDPQGVQKYKELRDTERLLDAAITRKRLDLCERINRRHAKLPKTLRIWISNTVEDQIWQGNGLNVDAFDFTPNMEASYRVTIQGQLISESDDDAPSGQDGQASDNAGQDETSKGSDSTAEDSRPRFSSFFRSITVDFDRSRFRNGAEQGIEWTRPDPNMARGHHLGAPAAGSQPAVSEFDKLVFKRHGDENTNITINLFRHETPERYRVNPVLADVIDMTEATHQEAVTALWEYIRFSGLQEDEEKRNFRCDERLKRILRDGADVGHMPMLGAYVEPLLEPLPPLTLPYTIRVDEEFHKDPRPTVYDIRVFVDDPSLSELQPIVNSPHFTEMFKEVIELDDNLSRLIQAICTSKAKHSFLSSFARDPATFVTNWLSSQRRDLEIITGEAVRGLGETTQGDDWRKGGSGSVWTSQTARESVNVLLSRQH